MPSGKNEEYLRKLRVGTNAALNALYSTAHSTAQAKQISAGISAGVLEVVKEVADESELTELELRAVAAGGFFAVQVGELLEKWARLRRDPRVSAALRRGAEYRLWSVRVQVRAVEDQWTSYGTQY